MVEMHAAEMLAAKALGGDSCKIFKVGDEFHMHGFIPNLPVSFGRIDYDSTGKAHLGGAMTIGYSLMYLWASGTVQSNNNWFLSPQFGIGLTGNFGAIQDPNDQSKIITAASLGIIIGFSSIAFAGQYDFLTKQPTFGVSQTFNAGSAINKATAFDVVVTKDGCE